MAGLFDLGAADVADTSNDWYTPSWLFDAAGITFDMDVAAPVDPNRRTCPARRYLTPLEDGLTEPWHGLVWMNPPYSRPRPWVDRWVKHPSGLALLAATRSASTGMALDGADAVMFFTGQFSRPNGEVDHNPWLLMLAARGSVAVVALERIAIARGVSCWDRLHSAERTR